MGRKLLHRHERYSVFVDSPSFSEGFWFSDSAPTPFILAVVTDSFHASDFLAKAPVTDDEFSCRARSYDFYVNLTEYRVFTLMFSLK